MSNRNGIRHHLVWDWYGEAFYCETCNGLYCWIAEYRTQAETLGDDERYYDHWWEDWVYVTPEESHAQKLLGTYMSNERWLECNPPF